MSSIVYECYAMPMPHRTQLQVIKRRLVGKEGAERVRELRAILADLPDYRNGPYADIRKWVNGQIADSRMRARVVHHDSIAVRREGAAQVALVAAGISLPAILAATKADDAPPGAAARLAAAIPELEVVTVSVLDDESLDRLREAVWRLTGLLRVFLRRHGEADAEPVA